MPPNACGNQWERSDHLVHRLVGLSDVHWHRRYDGSEALGIDAAVSLAGEIAGSQASATVQVGVPRHMGRVVHRRSVSRENRIGSVTQIGTAL
jgi:hypothetical protein